MKETMAFEIIGTGRAVPPRRVSNNDLASQIETDDEWIRSHTGIGNRHIADENTACSDLAFEAAKNALAMAAGYKGEDEAERDKAAAEIAATIDIIVLATATGDYIGVPSTACLVQNRIGARNAAAMDVTAGCTGFVYGLETAAGLLNISAQRKRALVIGSEILTRVTNWDDRATCVLFGDGAGAVVLEKTESCNRSGLLQSLIYADGSGSESLVMRRGGSRSPYKKGEIVDLPIVIEMNGQEVYNFAVKAITETIEAMMKTENIKVEDISRIVPHQANARIVQAAARRLHIPLEKFYLNIEEYANTSAATIPIALDELNRNGQLKKGDLILTVGFGGGLTYGGNIIIW
ncbi:MAG: ketoacyl-ACP synthase III [Treponema sp.]|jgi:3-oxoacyl-[acyl-carrier-protein] synthase-3|nr:ketoacyl-ACP synthase III [Treponema sp.]